MEFRFWRVLKDSFVPNAIDESISQTYDPLEIYSISFVPGLFEFDNAMASFTEFLGRNEDDLIVSIYPFSLRC